MGLVVIIGVPWLGVASIALTLCTAGKRADDLTAAYLERPDVTDADDRLA